MIITEIGTMWSTLGSIVTTNKHLLASGLNLTWEMLRAFWPTIVKGNVTPNNIKKVHLTEEGREEGEEGGDGGETSLWISDGCTNHLKSFTKSK